MEALGRAVQPALKHLPFSTRRDGALSHYPTRHARVDRKWRHIGSDHGTRADDRSFADFHPWQNESPCPNKCAFTDGDLPHFQRQSGLIEFMGTRAEVNLLGDDRSPFDFDRAKAVSIRAIAEATPIVQGKIPWNLNSSALMDKRIPVNACAKSTQPKQPPRVERFWRPSAKQRPAILPDEHGHSCFDGPRRPRLIVDRVGLFVIGLFGHSRFSRFLAAFDSPEKGEMNLELAAGLRRRAPPTGLGSTPG